MSEGDAGYSHLMQIYLQTIAAVWEAVKRRNSPKNPSAAFNSLPAMPNHIPDPLMAFWISAKSALQKMSKWDWVAAIQVLDHRAEEGTP